MHSQGGDHQGFSPLFNGMVGVTAHLGCIALFGTILEKPTEWIYRKLANILQKVGGTIFAVPSQKVLKLLKGHEVP